MEEKEYLFIGGPWDGKRVAVATPRSQIYVAEPARWNNSIMQNDIPVTYHTYRIETIIMNKQEHTLFVHSPIKSEYIMSMLIAAYPDRSQ